MRLRLGALLLTAFYLVSGTGTAVCGLLCEFPQMTGMVNESLCPAMCLPHHSAASQGEPGRPSPTHPRHNCLLHQQATIGPLVSVRAIPNSASLLSLLAPPAAAISTMSLPSRAGHGRVSILALTRSSISPPLRL